jgi:hypothetical protein
MSTEFNGIIELVVDLNSKETFPQLSLSSKHVVFNNEYLSMFDSSSVFPSDVWIPDTYPLAGLSMVKAFEDICIRSSVPPSDVWIPDTYPLAGLSMVKAFEDNCDQNVSSLMFKDVSTIVDIKRKSKGFSIKNLWKKPNPYPELVDHTASMPPKRTYNVMLEVTSRKKGKPNSSRSEILIDE